MTNTTKTITAHGIEYVVISEEVKNYDGVERIVYWCKRVRGSQATMICFFPKKGIFGKPARMSFAV